MAFKQGSRAIFHMRDGVPGAGSMRDFSQYVATTGFTGPIDTAEVSTLGSRGKKYVRGLIDHTSPLDGPWNEESDEWLYSLCGASAYTDYEYAPAGSANGYPVYTGSCLVTAYQVTTAVGDAAKFTATIQFSGSTLKSLIS